MTDRNDNRITLRSLLVGALFSGVFAALTVVLENRSAMLPTANQIPLFPYILLMLCVTLINPLCRLVRLIRPLSTAEVLIIFMMGAVSSGISTFGLTGQVVPVIGSLFNRYWNNDQTEWNRYVEPYINESFFIAEPGIQKAARAYADAYARLAELRQEKSQAVQQSHNRPENAGAVSTTETLDSEIRDQEAEVKRKREELRKLEAAAAERVEVFRRGLPRGSRAYPGILFTAADDADTYFRRLARLIHGKQAAAQLHDALNLLDNTPKNSTPAENDAEKIRRKLTQAAAELEPCAEAESLRASRDALSEKEETLAADIRAAAAELVELNSRKRAASVEEADKLQNDIDRLNDRKEDLEEQKQNVEVALERNKNQIEAAENVRNAAARIRALHDTTADMPADVMRTRLHEILAAFPGFDASLRRFFLGDVPWQHWVRPLLHWGLLIGLTYMVLLTFNVLIFRQWAYNEKLIFPLAELPEFIAGKDSTGTGVPDLFKNGLFWTGFAIAAGVMGWNLLCRTGFVPGLKALDLNNSWTPYIRNSMFRGLVWGAKSAIFFTMIGVAFLIPKKVSFSLWFFNIFYMAQLLLLVAFGFGQNESSFPSEWWYTLNFRTAEGGGALIVFASLVMWKCRRYLLCAFSPGAVADAAENERRELRICSFLFLTGSLGMILLLWRVMGVNWFYAIFGYAVIMIITIGLVRAVAEGGVLGFQAWVSPFHLIRHTVGFKKSFASPHLFAPLMVYYSIMFLDIKTFIAPAMANSLKIRDDLRMGRMRYHLAMLLGIGVACVVAIGTAIMMCYDGGADAMHSWFYTSFPKSLFARIADISKVPPAATAAGRFWLIGGAALMAALLFFRQSFFWLPHPIGLIMLVNPLMRTYWFSILLGWMAKALVTKYGNKETYAKVRCGFIGLIVGELVIVAVAMVLSLILDKNLGIDLNRQ
jgi:hypothetical protein